MSETKTGSEVIKQAADDSPANTNPVALSQVIAQIVGVVVSVAIFKGYIEPTEGTFITAQSVIIVGAVQTLAAIIGAAIGRAKAYSPQSAAKVAVLNAKSLAGTPVLPA